MSSHRVSIFGVTGSIGKSAVSVIRDANAVSDASVFEVDTVCAGSDVAGLADAARAVGANLAVIRDEAKLPELKDRLAGSGIEVAGGDAAIVEAARRPVDRVLAAVVGAAGLRSALAALETGNDVALANKESVVCGGRVLMAMAQKSGARIIPVDSEHNAIFQVLDGGRQPARLTLTASGGPFRTWSREQMGEATLEQAVAHPNWSMGPKNSIDSATLMNKALELIEASYLFEMPEDRIDVLVHPQSIVHGMVSYPDGSVLAQLGTPDMRTPIAHALTWPQSTATTVPRLDLGQLGRLEFEPVDESRFIAVRLARQAARQGCLASTVLNSANEVAVAAFVAGQCGFLDIASTVERVLSDFCEGHFGRNHTDDTDIDCVLSLDALARQVARDLLSRNSVR